MARLIEDYIKQDVEVVAYVDNNPNKWGWGIWHGGQKVSILQPDMLRNISFDYCIIAVVEYREIKQQCTQKLMISEDKLLLTDDFSKWDIELLRSIFNENIIGNSRKYNIDGTTIDLGKGHNLPFFQKNYKMYDKFIPCLGELTKKKRGKIIIDIGANVGDTLAAMWHHTEDKFVEVEPVEEFFNLLTDNVSRLDHMERVCVEHAFITDKVEELYQAKILKGGTAHKERKDAHNTTLIPSKSVDGLIREKGIEYEDVDLLKIDTDGYDADCLFSARELLKYGNALIYWENYVEAYEQYKKYKEAYGLLSHTGYITFFIFDNYGNYLCKGGTETLNTVMDYVLRTYTDCIGSTFTYFDVLACKLEDIRLCENMIKKYTDQYPLWRISRRNSE